MAEYAPLTPLPFLPILGKFDLNTYLPGSSDYEIMARVVETYNQAVALFNKLIGLYGPEATRIDELEEKLQGEINDINTELTQIKSDIEALKRGDYIDAYIDALSKWIDNNFQAIIARIAKYVWFELDKDGYLIAYIPTTWEFIDFYTVEDMNLEDYGKLQLLWQPEVVN